MARPKRNIIPNNWYFIRNDSIPSSTLFCDSSDRRHFLSLLDHAVEMFSLGVRDCALPKDSCLLVVLFHKDNASLAMKYLFGSYALYLNRKHGRYGPLFCGRFKSRIVETTEQLNHVTQFVQQASEQEGTISNANPFPKFSKTMNLSVEEIFEEIIKTYHTTLWKIQSDGGRIRNKPRLITIYCLRFLLGMSLKEIVRTMHFSNQNAAAQAIYRAKKMLKQDEEAKNLFTELKRNKLLGQMGNAPCCKIQGRAPVTVWNRPAVAVPI